MPLSKNAKAWLKGLIAANISGGAGAVATSSVVTMIAPESFNLKHQLLNVILLVVGTFVIHAILGGFAYLAKSPLPDDATS